jgi:hypothetical protein
MKALVRFLMITAVFLAMLRCGVPESDRMPDNAVDCDPHVVNGVEVQHCEVEADESDDEP